jgi:hypothetical protein
MGSTVERGSGRRFIHRGAIRIAATQKTRKAESWTHRASQNCEAG